MRESVDLSNKADFEGKGQLPICAQIFLLLIITIAITYQYSSIIHPSLFPSKMAPTVTQPTSTVPSQPVTSRKGVKKLVPPTSIQKRTKVLGHRTKPNPKLRPIARIAKSAPMRPQRRQNDLPYSVIAIKRMGHRMSPFHLPVDSREEVTAIVNMDSDCSKSIKRNQVLQKEFGLPLFLKEVFSRRLP